MLKIINNCMNIKVMSPAVTTHISHFPQVKDEHLAKQFPDLQPQLQDPSPQRHEFDRQAQDDRLLYNERQIDNFVESLLRIEKKQSDTSTPESEEKTNTVKHVVRKCYANSPTFRRIFNYHLQPNLSHQTSLNRAPRGTFTLSSLMPDIERSYISAEGHEIATHSRIMLQNLVVKLTGLPRNEAGHSRGAVIELTNILLKETGDTQPACISQYSFKKQQTRSSNAINALQNIATSGTIQTNARQLFEKQVNTRLKSINENINIRDPLLKKQFEQEKMKTRDYT